MRILHIDSGREMRGGQWQVLYLMRGLHALGHQVRLLARRKSELFRVAKDEGIDTRPIRLSSLAVGADGGVDLVHAHDARSHTFGLLTGKPLVIARRVAFPVRATPASRFKYRRKAHFIAVSRFVEKTLIAAGVCQDRISTVYDGVSILTPSSGRRAGVLALDSADPLKGKALVSQAVGIAGVEVRFSIDLPRDLPSAEVFVYVTESEGLGSAALLAMAAETPVIASRVGGLPEVVEDGICGLLTSNDPRAIAGAISGLLGDPALARRLAAAGRRRVEERFSLDRMVRETVSVYEKVLV
jgi:hypothetical protein